MATQTSTATPGCQQRERELMRLLPLWPHEIADRSLAGRLRVVALLRRALRAERKRGLAGHWTYDLSRHAQLIALYHAERVATCKHASVSETHEMS